MAGERLGGRTSLQSVRCRERICVGQDGWCVTQFDTADPYLVYAVQATANVNNNSSIYCVDPTLTLVFLIGLNLLFGHAKPFAVGQV